MDYRCGLSPECSANRVCNTDTGECGERRLKHSDGCPPADNRFMSQRKIHCPTAIFQSETATVALHHVWRSDAVCRAHLRRPLPAPRSSTNRQVCPTNRCLHQPHSAPVGTPRKILPARRYTALTAFPKCLAHPSPTSSSPQPLPPPPLTEPRIELLRNQRPAQTHSNDIGASIEGGFLQVAVSAAHTQRSPQPRSPCGRSRYSPRTSHS